MVDPRANRHPDLVKRAWNRAAPDLVWVSDFTQVSTSEGTVYVAFLQDAYSRRILGFTVRTSKSTELIERVLLQAVSTRERRVGQRLHAGVIVHSDAGSPYTSLAFGARLRVHGMQGSIGGVGTALDNALMEGAIGLFRTEVICRRPWRLRLQVENVTTNWVAWFNRSGCAPSWVTRAQKGSRARTICNRHCQGRPREEELSTEPRAVQAMVV